MAILRLEEATRLVPNRPEWDLTLARTYMRAGFFGLGPPSLRRRCGALNPENADAVLSVSG